MKLPKKLYLLVFENGTKRIAEYNGTYQYNEDSLQYELYSCLIDAIDFPIENHYIDMDAANTKIFELEVKIGKRVEKRDKTDVNQNIRI